MLNTPQEAIAQFRDAIQAAGLIPPDEIKADGKLRRFASNGKRRDDAGWYLLHGDGIPAGSFGDWRTGHVQTWRADIGRAFTLAEESEHRARVEAMRREREAEDAKRHAEAATRAAAIWKDAMPAREDHPYLARKCIKPVPTLRELPINRLEMMLGYLPKSKGEPLAGRVLVAPVKVGNKVSTAELIDEAGRKSAIFGGVKAGGYWAAQPLPEGNGDGLTLLIGEGVATCLSAREATGHPAIAALSAGNLPAVAKAMRERYPAAALVILADLVKVTGAPDPHAVEAARAVGGVVAIPDFGTDRPDGATDFNDLAQLCGLEAVGRAIASAAASARASHQEAERNAPAAESDGDGWPEPQPLSAKVEPEPYPVDALPDTIRAAVEEVAGFVKAPFPMVASSALAALSLACQAHIDAKRAERLQGPVGLFLLTIADSGERKSTCDGFFVSAIRQYQEEQAETMKPAIKRHESDLDAWTAERDGILSAIKDAGKRGKVTDKLRADLAELQDAKPEPPRVPKLLLGDETPENLAWSLARQWPSAGVVSSEAGLIFGAHGMGKDSVMRNLGLLNVLWDGGVHSVGRRTSESFTVKGARLTVALQIQEPTLRSFFDRSGGLARGTGFLARFLVAWPESTQGFRPFTEAPPNWPHLAAFHRRIAAILANPAPMSEEGELSPALLMLAPEAKAAWVAFHDAIEGELASGGELYDVRDVASKFADNAARLAALFQIFEHGMGGAVGLEAFEGAEHGHQSRWKNGRFWSSRLMGTSAMP